MQQCESSVVATARGLAAMAMAATLVITGCLMLASCGLKGPLLLTPAGAKATSPAASAPVLR